ncbi:MAG: CARDB domain-containing protein [Bacteroidota bacterium]
MRKGVIVILYFISLHLSAQQIIQVEYFIDTDPGIGMATQLPITPDSLIDTTFVLPIDTLADGLHTFYVRMKNDSMRWSFAQKHIFFKTEGNASPTLTNLEYFFDNDPGLGMATPVSLSGQAMLDTSLTIAIDTLSTGLHTLYLRGKADNGFWSFTQQHTFFKTEGIASPTLTAVEYFFDNDPGLGMATPIPLNGLSELDSSFFIPIDTLSTGLHTLYIRSKADNEFWSFTQQHTFFKIEGNASPVMVAMEYFIDNDPGYGNGTAITVPSTGQVDTTFNLDLSGLENGLHTVYVRTLADNGFWSYTQRHTFFVSQGSGGIKTITQLEYFWDIDPGYGNGIPIDFSGHPTPHDTLDIADTISMSGLTVGLHELNIRAKDEAGYWSLVYVEEVNNDSTNGLFPELLISRDSVFYSTLNCSNIGTDTFKINNPGGSQLNFIFSDNLSWLSIDPVNEGVPAGDSVTLTASFDPSGLAAGSYTGQATVVCNDPNNALDTVHFTFELVGQPLLSYSDSLVDFGEVQITTTEVHSLQIANLGCAAITVDSLVLMDTVFSIPNIMATTLQAGENMTVDITFSPLSENIFNAQLWVYAAGSIDTVLIQGEGIGIPDINMPVSPINFYTNNCIDTFQQIFVMENLGTDTLEWQLPPNTTLPNWLQVSSLAGGIPQPSSYPFVVNIYTEGLASDTFNFEINILTNDPDEPSIVIPIELVLDGAPIFSVINDSIPINFNEIEIPYLGDSVVQAVIVKNEGCDSLFIDSVSFLTNSFWQFDVGNFWVIPAEFAPNETKIVLMYFKPDSIGIHTDTITLFSNVGIQKVPLIGTGVGLPEIFIENNSISQSFTDCNGTYTDSIKIKNSGTSDLTIAFNNNGLPGWLQINSFNDTLPPGDSVYFNYTLDAQTLANGTHPQNINITSNDPDHLNNTVSFLLTLDGVSTFLVAADSLDFGTVGTGSTTSLSFNIQNEGCAPFAINNLIFNTVEFSNGLSLPQNIPAYFTQSITIDFSSAMTGLFDGQLIIETDLGNDTIALSGIGCPANLQIVQADTTICGGDTILLTTNLTGNLTWSTGAITDSIFIQGPDSYSVTYSDTLGCSLTSNLMVLDTFQHAVIEVVGFSTICLGDSTLLIGQNASIFNWSTGATNDSIYVSPADTTVYYLTAENNSGCMYEDSVEIGVIPAVAPDAVSNMLPEDESSGLTQPIIFSWLPGSNTINFDFYIWEQDSLPPNAPTAAGLNQINYLVNANLNSGVTYNWQVHSVNSCFETASMVQEFTMQHLPDLEVLNVGVPIAGFSGQEVDISWEVKNIGLESTGGDTWLDYIYVSSQPQFDLLTATYLGAVGNLSALMSGESYVQTATFNLPNGISGNYYVFVNSNPFGYQVQEVTLANNVNTPGTVLPITLTPPPDLEVISMITPATTFSGLDIEVTWTVQNNGTGITEAASWVDGIYISSDTIFNANATYLGNRLHEGALSPDSFYVATKTVTLPNNIDGNYYFYITTDFGNSVFEFTGEANNTTRSDVVDIILLPPPDLAVSAVSISEDTLSNGAPLEVTWSITNIGASSPEDTWLDRIYLLPQDTFILDSAILLGEQPHTADLFPFNFYVKNYSLNIPVELEEGNYFLFVKTDATEAINEGGVESNNLSNSIPIEILNPDLVVSEINHLTSANSGGNFLANLTIKNNGSGDILSRSWSEEIMISTHSVFQPDSVISLGFLNNNSLDIESDSSYIDSVLVAIPNGISGEYYLYIKTDSDNTVLENNESNNILQSSAPIQISLTPPMDLNLLTVSAPGVANAGDEITVNYEVKNIGSANLDTAWTDKIFLSNSSTWDSINNTQLRTLNHSFILEKDSSYEISTIVTLPSSLLSGTSYIHVFTDAENKIYEHLNEANNILASNPISISAVPPSDFKVTTVVMADTINSGETIPISWTVENQGAASNLQNSWSDAAFLSDDLTWDGNDLLIDAWQQVGSILPGTNYSTTQMVEIPNGVSGEYYIVIVSDYEFQINDQDFSNNFLAYQAQSGNPPIINLTPPSDLRINELIVPYQAIAGQPLEIVFEVENHGTGETDMDSWNDAFYISNNFSVQNATLIKSQLHNGKLLPTENYRDTLIVDVPNNLSGNFVFVCAVDQNDAVYEHNGEQNNTEGNYINIIQPQPCDLIPIDISLPAMTNAGDSLAIRWKIKNEGINPAIGLMKENIYLSTDTIWDIDDVLLATEQKNINLGSQGLDSNEICVAILDVAIGNYYVIVRTDILNNIPEINENNNAGYSNSPVMVDVAELPLDSLVNRNLKNQQPIYYRIEIPDSLAGESMLVSLGSADLSGKNELYLKYGDIPTRVAHDFIAPDLFSNDLELVVPEIQAGTYYLMAQGETINADTQSVDLLAEILFFEIREIDTDEGGNSGQVTVAMRGAKFDPGMSVQLANDSVQVIGYDLAFVDQTLIYISFDLKGKPIGFYDVEAINSVGDSTELVDGFVIEQGLPPDLQFSFSHPPNTRTESIVEMKVEYKNNGNTDLIDPVILLNSIAGTPVAYTIEALEDQLVELTLELQEEGAPTGILRPNGVGVIHVFSKAVTALGITLVEE